MVLNRIRIRLSVLKSLILFFIVPCCTTPAARTSFISVQWNDSIPSALIIPNTFFSRVDESTIPQDLQVHLINDHSGVAMSGEYTFTSDAVVFRPLIPFTRSLRYEVRYRGEELAQIAIPAPDASRASEVLAIFPTQDSVPENLLKMYVHFSKPMAEMDPLSFVQLRSHDADSMLDAFLDLRPALWNREGTMLTLWLDPGRIKRDLQPNKRAGSPLVAGHRYKLILLKTWPTKEGATLKETVSKTFYVYRRDDLSPDPSEWEINTPAPGTLDALVIRLHESLDFVLLKEAMDVLDPDGRSVDGKITVTHEESVVHFFPDAQWRRGSYLIKLESRLEDLAGNNLNRLFDQDVKDRKEHAGKDFFQLKFAIR